MNDKLTSCFMRVYNTNDMKKTIQFIPDSRLTNPVGFDILVVARQDITFDYNLAEVLYYGGVI